MTAVSSEVDPFPVSRAMSFEELKERCRAAGAAFWRDGVEMFSIVDRTPAGAGCPNEYDEAGLKRFCSNRMR